MLTMRLRFRVLLTLVVAAAFVVGTWIYAKRDLLERQWMCYQVGAAEGYEQGKGALRWFEGGPDREGRLGELVAKWGTGNPRFDFFLARYVGDSESSEALRERFSLEFGWRDQLPGRWAHYWAWQSPQAIEEEIASIVAYLDTLASSDPPRQLTWREILDLQAIFYLTGHTERARRLKPSNWRPRYAAWRERQPARPTTVARPDLPFEDWKGPVPK